MNYFKKIFFLISLLLFTNTYSQNRQGGDRDAMMAQYQNMNFNISGKVIDIDTGEALEYATITLSNQLNKDEVTGGISDENGNFSIEVKPGMYDLSLIHI